jgi:hypothetical protein
MKKNTLTCAPKAAKNAVKQKDLNPKKTHTWHSNMTTNILQGRN